MDLKNLFQVERTMTFYAAHRNVEAGKKCAALHGHRYEVLLKVQAARNQQTGVSILFDELEKPLTLLHKKFDHSTILQLHDPLMATLQAHHATHQDLNLVPFPETTSAENLAAYICEFCVFYFRGMEHKGHLRVVSVSVRETDSCLVTYNNPN